MAAAATRVATRRRRQRGDDGQRRTAARALWPSSSRLDSSSSRRLSSPSCSRLDEAATANGRRSRGRAVACSSSSPRRALTNMSVYSPLPPPLSLRSPARPTDQRSVVEFPLSSPRSARRARSATENENSHSSGLIFDSMRARSSSRFLHCSSGSNSGDGDGWRGRRRRRRYAQTSALGGCHAHTSARSQISRPSTFAHLCCHDGRPPPHHATSQLANASSTKTPATAAVSSCEQSNGRCRGV